MKGMNRITRGTGFAGAIRYAQFGEKGAPRNHEGIVIGGNISGTSPRSIIRELNATKEIRPDVHKPVWHNSLRLPKGDTLARSTWSTIGDTYMRNMGFSEHHPRVYFLHDDKEGQHIHIIASRIGYDGKLYLGKNEGFRSTSLISTLEREFGLTVTKAVTRDSDGRVKLATLSKLSKNEIQKSVRLDKEPERIQLQKLVKQALTRPITATQFVESLQVAGVDVRVNIARTGSLNGFKFGLNGVYFSGSKLGSKYSCASLLQEGLSYDKDRDSEFLSRFRSEVRDSSVYSRTASSVERYGSGRDSLTDEGLSASERNVVESCATYSPDSTNDVSYPIASPVSDLSIQQFRDNVLGAESLDPDSGAGPLQTGDRVSDEFSRKLHNLRLSEAKQGVKLAGKLEAELSAHQAAQKTTHQARDEAEKAKQRRLNNEDEMIMNISQELVAKGFGFAMQSKIIIRTGDDKNDTTISNSKARKNNTEISVDAAPRRS
ncbi:relaxase/mobilization nuclease domain-containing protein [Pseudomonas sp. RTC3]|uniref:relaxase/mobilization nuclease domain-containing protein n=1 Tax=Pseudomonas sp. 5C2 TaxID=3048588 RepID=UPI002AB34B06|nr:relaxase/mobilization nuclease domain-containing protein [Pseudomonas sp. 5C2]MDY7567488.1 relaxase/mobilization nuclease domain-containing protein [Pseudomonas sp. 5C2]MEB0064550.1 relaxase/mobilization nuclease domain-containing protein [Pseudomonas sp. RTC3]MEB0243042.1 relaxase/mobilization nuclease domain-containing protein [Pseudomonas sp. 5C2]